jgi:hypothetical protein
LYILHYVAMEPITKGAESVEHIPVSGSWVASRLVTSSKWIVAKSKGRVG